MIFLKLSLRYLDLAIIACKCLAPSLHAGFDCIANHMGAYTLMMNVKSVFKLHDGESRPMYRRCHKVMLLEFTYRHLAIIEYTIVLGYSMQFM